MGAYYHYILSKDTTPSEALDNYCKDCWLVDPGIIMELVYSLVLRDFLGLDIYNRYLGEPN
jgi:hypothetical protein